MREIQEFGNGLRQEVLQWVPGAAEGLKLKKNVKLLYKV